MTNRFVIVILIVLGFAPILIFVINFLFLPISGSPNDWGTFATYFNGTSGTLFSILAFYLLYLTLQTQINQNIETIFFNYIETFSREKGDIRDKIFKYEAELLSVVHKDQRVLPGSESEKLKKKEYIEMLRKQLIEGYSIMTATPRLNREFNMYFRFINNFTALISDKKLSNENKMRLRNILLSILSETEIKMICYYYYLFFDIINSNDINFSSNNFVKDSGIFKGDLYFSDDFFHNFDPREGHFDGAIMEIRAEYSNLRM